MKLDDATFSRWQDWITRIEDDVQDLMHFRQLYQGFEEIVANNLEHINANEGGCWCEFTRLGYVSLVVMGMRRHLKDSPDSVSLVRLMRQLQKSCSQFTYEFYLDRFPLQPNYVDWQRALFDRFSTDGNSLSYDRIESDIQLLRSRCQSAEDLADQRLAHLDRRKHSGKINAKEIDNGLVHLDQLVCKYLCLLTGSSPVTLEATMLFEWQQIFRVPLDVVPEGI